MIAESDSQQADAGDDIDAASAQLPVSARRVLAPPPRVPDKQPANRARRPVLAIVCVLLLGGRSN
ncbi:hypothetical protein NKJ59_13505, partial [Mesorhizobium australicum]|uniref:hypothetical protein n=1 Tax=Mesorhizobium australicum TaxID=536018 RepID=UPI003335694D